jgi:hypothetical protein
MAYLAVNLTERRTTSIGGEAFHRLQRSEVAWRLIEEGIISLTNAKTTPYGVRAGAYVGQAILEDGTQLEIQEKSQGALAELLQWTVPEDVRRVYVPSAVDSQGKVIETFAIRFLEYLGQYLMRGRLKGYRHLCASTERPCGRIDVIQTVRQWARGHRSIVTCWKPHLSAELDANKLLRLSLGAAERMLLSGAADRNWLLVARSYSRIMHDAGDLRGPELSPSSLSARFEREVSRAVTVEELRNALLFGRAVVLHLGMVPRSVECTLPESFFLNLESLFEDAVRNALKGICPTERGSQLRRPLFPASPDRFVADPDFVVLDSNGPLLVGDCKYKVLVDTDLHSDVYQLTSHCQSIQCKRAVLVFPGEAFSHIVLGDSVAGISVHVCEVALTRLEADLRAMLARVLA